jgi:hypothetical protein
MKTKIVNHYTSGKMACQCCGVSGLKFLTIDHIDGSGKYWRTIIGNQVLGKDGRIRPAIRPADFYRWIIKNNYPTNLQILCYNCNCAKGKYGICPHKDMKKVT